MPRSGSRPPWRAIDDERATTDRGLFLPLRGWDHAGQADELFGVLRFVVDQDFIVHMGSGTAAGAAEKADLLVLGDPLRDRDDVAVKMGIKGGDAASVIDWIVRMVFASFVRGLCREADRRVSRTSVANFDWIIGRFLGWIPIATGQWIVPSRRGPFGEITQHHDDRTPCSPVSSV